MKDKLVLTQYQIHTSLPASITVALVADLHEHDPKPLLHLIKQAKPDLILVAGDTFERREKGRIYDCMEKQSTIKKLIKALAYKFDDLFDAFANTKNITSENSYRFLQEASKICSADGRTAAQIFLSPGNHDPYFNPEDYKVMEKTGATLLDNADCTAIVRGQNIRIGGLSSKPDLKWLSEFASKDGFKILLCHHPEYYFRYIKDRFDFNLILSGHVHGGQWRIGNQGIYSPGQGLFPKYTRGVYDQRLVISAGCANTASVPRFGNPCELVVLKLAGCA